MRSRGYLLIFRHDDGRRDEQRGAPARLCNGNDIIFPGLAAFDMLYAQGPFLGIWIPQSRNNVGQELILDFTTTHFPASLVGFDGGSIVGFDVRSVSPTFHPLYLSLTGSITPVPELSSLALLGGGVLVFTQGLRRKLM